MRSIENVRIAVCAVVLTSMRRSVCRQIDRSIVQRDEAGRALSRVAPVQYRMVSALGGPVPPLVCVTWLRRCGSLGLQALQAAEGRSSLLSWVIAGNWPGSVRRFASARSHFPCCGIHPGYRWYGPVVPKSPILPLAAAVTAVALGASPAQAAPLLAGKRDGAKVVAFPLLAVKGQTPASVGCHVSHSSHQSMCRALVVGMSPMFLTVSHVSSVPAPAPTSAAPVATQAAPAVRARPRPPARSTRAGRPPPRRPRAAWRAAQRIWRAAARPRAMAGAARSSLSRRSAPLRAGSGGSPAGGGRDEPGGRRAWRRC